MKVDDPDSPMKKLIKLHNQMIIDVVADTDVYRWQKHYRDFYQATAQNLRRYLKQSGQWLDESDVIQTCQADASES
jgi:hypothetical protein